MPTRRFLFLRHGETDWNREGRIQGHTDIALNATGIAQAQAAAELLAGERFDRIIASPLSRAFDTARIVNDASSRPLHTDAGLIERGFGAFEGHIVAEIKRRHGIPMTQSLSTILPPDAEQWDTTLARTRATIRKWTERHPDETLLFVSHGGVFGALHEQLAGVWLASGNAIPFLFAPGTPAWSVTALAAAAEASAPALFR
jgi:broad specificity phosphatase PhoE